MTMKPPYTLERVNGSLPTIVDADGSSVLAIDSRVVNGALYRTPVFASDAHAAVVLAALNAAAESAPAEGAA